VSGFTTCPSRNQLDPRRIGIMIRVETLSQILAHFGSGGGGEIEDDDEDDGKTTLNTYMRQFSRFAATAGEFSGYPCSILFGSCIPLMYA
jgi:hypothetical protein